MGLFTVIGGAYIAHAETPTPEEMLAILLRSPQSNATLVALASTEDDRLRPLFEALSRSAEVKQRLFALTVLAEKFGSKAAPVLSDRLFDPEKSVRVRAMARLFGLKALTEMQIRQALASEDEEIRLLAANAFFRMGRGREALPVLEALSQSSTPGTACSASLCLVAMGRTESLRFLEAIVADPQTDEGLLSQILSQVGEEKIFPAVVLARRLAMEHPSIPVRARACSAIAEAEPAAGAFLYEIISGSDQILFNVNVLGMLATMDDAASWMEKLSADGGPVGVLARFDLARLRRQPELADRAREALMMGHPMVVDYVLERMEEDQKSRQPVAAPYQDALLVFIGETPVKGTTMTELHYRLARASTLLAEMETPQASQGLKELLAQRYSSRVRAVAAGLLRVNKPSVCELARPLLESPYEELRTNAALILGRFGDQEAQEPLKEIVAYPERHPTALVAMASWYLLKVAGQDQVAVQSLSELIPPMK